MKTTHLAQAVLLPTLVLAGFAFVGCGGVEQADLGDGNSHEDVAENRALMTTAPVPQQYQLSSGQLDVSYTTPGLDRQAHFTYQDAQQRLDFKGDEIRTSTCDLGTLVTVPLRVSVDSGSTTFTLLVPDVSLDAGGSAPVATQGIMATHDFSVLQNVDEGQKDHYTVTPLSGTARLARF